MTTEWELDAGRDIRSGTVLCLACGEVIAQPGESEPETCPHCGEVQE